MAVVRGMLGLVRRHPDVAALTLIGVVALLLRLAFLYRVPVILTGDSQSHYLPGYDLAFGNQFEPELRRPPGYAFFAAGTILVLGEELRALVFAQHLLGVATAMLTYLLGRVTFGRPAGLAAGLLVALNGALVLSGQSVMTETLFTFLLVATLLALLLAGRSGRWGWALLAGIALGAAALTRPVAQALVILVPLAFLVYTRRPWPVVRGTALVGIGFALVLVPWMVRNLSEHGTLSAAGGLGRSLVARTIKYDEGYFDQARPAADGDLQGRGPPVHPGQAQHDPEQPLGALDPGRPDERVRHDPGRVRPLDARGRDRGDPGAAGLLRRRQPQDGVADRPREAEGGRLLRALGDAERQGLGRAVGVAGRSPARRRARPPSRPASRRRSG